MNNATTIANDRPRGSTASSSQPQRTTACHESEAEMQLQLRDPSVRIHWIAIAVTTQAGNYLSSKDWTGRMVVSIRRDIYTYLRLRSVDSCASGKKPYPGCDPAIPNLGFCRSYAVCACLLRLGRNGMKLNSLSQEIPVP